jgi:hypothetical protein
MGIIGYNTIGATAENLDSGDAQSILDNASFTYVAPANEQVFKLWFYIGATYTGDGSGVGLAVYDITSGAASAPLIAEGTITSLTVNSWNSVTITPVALTETNTYAVGLRVISATNVRSQYDYGSNSGSLSTLNGTSAFASTWTDQSNSSRGRSMYAETESASAALTLDSAPSTIAKAETGVSFVVSTPTTAPTTGNTTVINSGDALTVTSVTGSDPYTINCTAPIDITKQAGSYAWTITVDAENVVTASIPLTVQIGWSNIILDTPLTASGYMLEGYVGDVPVTSDTMEYETTATLTPGTNSEWIWTFAPIINQTVARRVVQIDGTVGATADITYLVDTIAPIISLPTGTKTGSSTASGTITTDEDNGQLYYYASINSTELLATIKASGSSRAVNATGLQSVGFTGLSGATAYYAHYVHTDDAGNDSNVSSSTSFTTDVAPISGGGILRNVLRSPLKNILRNILK